MLYISNMREGCCQKQTPPDQIRYHQTAYWLLRYMLHVTGTIYLMQIKITWHAWLLRCCAATEHHGV